MYILENSDLEPLLNSIKELTEEVKQLRLKSLDDIIYDNEDALKILKVSRKTLQNYRDKGLISFSQIGRVIYFRHSDFEEFLNKHRFKAFAK
jgi:predicted DNA-binding protein (UPF0251 family)